MMRSTNEIIDAARAGDPCTEEELRCCIMAMHSWGSLVRSLLLTIWSKPERTDGSKPTIRALTMNSVKTLIETAGKGWNKPVDEWIGPRNMPGTPEMRERMALAHKVWAAAERRASNGSSKEPAP